MSGFIKMGNYIMSTSKVVIMLAAFSMFGALLGGQPASARSKNDCPNGETYDVSKGSCQPTVGATSYSSPPPVAAAPHKHKKKKIKQP